MSDARPAEAGEVAGRRPDGDGDQHEPGDEGDGPALVGADQFEHRTRHANVVVAGAMATAQNSTVGTVRAASSASKYSRRSNFSMLAKITVGNCCSLLL